MHHVVITAYSIHYTKLYDIAEGSKPVRLAAVLDSRNIPSDLVINERTTVAMAYTMAQFTDGRHIGGKNPGLKNAAEIAQNLVNPGTGELDTRAALALLDQIAQVAKPIIIRITSYNVCYTKLLRFRHPPSQSYFVLPW